MPTVYKPKFIGSVAVDSGVMTENTKSTNAEMTKEDFEKSLLISSKTAYMDPRVDYRKWLRNTLHAVLEDAVAGDEGSKNFLKTAIGTLILWQSEERIKINFDTWIWPYIDLVEEAKNNPNVDTAPCSVED